MRLLDVTLRQDEGTTALVGTVRRDDREFELYFRYPEWCGDFLRPNADPFLAAMSVPAAVAGEVLSSDLPASPYLLRGLTRAVDVLSTRNPDQLGRLTLDAPIRIEPLPRGPDRAASFFSCGVDSFDTALQNLRYPAPGNPPLTYALFFHGLETQLEREAGAETAAAHAARTAQALGLRCIVGRTNIRSHFPLDYGRLYAGMALSAAALSLAGGYSVCFLPSSVFNASLHGYGHEMLIDEPCSTEYLRLENDGGDVSRTHKVIRSVARSDIALANLRSCYVNSGALENCGVCSKCLRTMMALEIAGVLKNSGSFPKTLQPGFLEKMGMNRPDHIYPNIAAIREVGVSLWMIPVLERKAREVILKNALREYLEESPVRGLLASWRERKRARALEKAR